MRLLNQFKKSGLKELVVLLKRLLIVFVVYQILRIVFFLANITHFDDVGFSHFIYMMWGGLRFDLTAILYINSLFMLLSVLPLKVRHKKIYQNLLFYIFISTNAIGYIFNILDVYYFDFILKRSTVELFMFAGESNIGKLLFQFLKDYWMGFLFWIALVYITYKWYKSIKSQRSEDVHPLSYYGIGFGIMLLTMYFSIIGIRGGFTRTTRPISLNNAGAYINKPLEMAIVLNTPFSIFRTLDTKAFKKKQYFSDEEVETIYTPHKKYISEEAFTNNNVVIIIVESLAKEYIGALNKDIDNYKGYTPFLDSLITKSHTFSNAFANGRKSIDALPSVIASVPSLVQPYILSSYSTNKINGFGTILKEKGYKTAFLHGAPKGSMGFDAFMNTAGYDHFFGLEDYDNDADFDGSWGIWDENFLQYTAKTLNTFKEPFLASVFTLSSHHPFKVPEKYKNKFIKGTLPIHKPVQYTDYSLKQFFKTASKMPWFDNTIFVITADHCNQTYIPEYKTSIGAFAIPIIIYSPNKANAAKIDTIPVHQVDILPTVLRKLNYSGEFISFGTDPNSKEKPFAVNYTNQTWQYYENDYLLQYRDEQVIGLFLYKKDRLLRNNLLESEKLVKEKMSIQLKAYIQQYYNRLIENKLHITKK